MAELKFKFDTHKTAQAVAFLLRHSGGKRSKGFLVKMLYAADRRQLRRVGAPITGDSAFSLPDGPILSKTLELLCGKVTNAFWSNHFSSAPNGVNTLIRLKMDLPDDLLSENEKDSLARACDYFGNKTWEELKRWFHDPKNCGEWEDPGSSRKPIRVESIFKQIGKSDEFIEEIKSLQKERELVSALFS
jgi:hypothetical protein